MMISRYVSELSVMIWADNSSLTRSRSVNIGASVDGVHRLPRDTVEYPFVVILDEADNIHDHDVIERLHAVPLVSNVAISHDPQSWLAQIPIDASHSFDGDRDIQSQQYGTEELANILKARSNQGLEKNLVTQNQLRLLFIRCSISR